MKVWRGPRVYPPVVFDFHPHYAFAVIAQLLAIWVWRRRRRWLLALCNTPLLATRPNHALPLALALTWPASGGACGSRSSRSSGSPSSASPWEARRSVASGGAMREWDGQPPPPTRPAAASAERGVAAQ